jgi:hypothetical protein
MCEEAAQDSRTATEADEGAAGLTMQLGGRGGQGIEQLALDGAIAQLLGIQLRRIGRQPLQAVVVRMGGYKRLHDLRAVGVEPVPDDDQRPVDLAPEVAQSGDDLLAMDAAAEVAGVQPGWSSQRRDQGDDAGDLPPLTEPAQDRRPAAAGPGGAEAGPKRVTRLVHEGNGAPCSTSPLLTRGQSRLSQASTNSSSRSRARAIGCCGLKPCARKARPSKRKWL